MRARKSTTVSLVLIGVLIASAAVVVHRIRSAQRRESERERLVIMGRTDKIPSNRQPGRWRKSRGASPPGDGEESERVRDLLALPYLQGHRKAPEKENVTVYDPERAYPGWNLFTSGHAPEALLIDMEGRVVHRWGLPIEKVWTDVPDTVHGTFWRRVHWYPDGSLLVIWEGIGIIKIDRDSNLLWARRGGYHHQMFVTGDGRIHVIYREARILPRIDPDRPTLEDMVTVLDPDGNLLERHSLLEAFENSDYRSLLRRIPKRENIFHTNSIYVFDGSLEGVSEYFREGYVLLSMRNLEAIAILDPQAGRIVWAQSGADNGMWLHQHDPLPLPNGNFLLFDNLGNRKWSRVIEFEPFSGRIDWSYDGREDGELFSRSCGISQRLPNGNTLITETDAGRVIEVTPEKEIVWEYYNPYRAGEENELIATIMMMNRVEKDFFPWLK